MADVTLYVPISVAVSVRSHVFLGEAVSLGETANGIVVSSHEEHTPVEGAPTADSRLIPCGDEHRQGRADQRRAARAAGRAGRDALAAVTDGFRRGLQPGIRQPNDGAGAALGERGGE